MLKRHGWSWQQPARRAIEREDDAVEVWKETWPRVRPSRRSLPPRLRNTSARAGTTPALRCGRGRRKEHPRWSGGR
ncbi:winged helix-turn-helix domain-containing protein [Streptomyces sp. NPDC057494]|uniref:winged helix-turn-helix domain-containing protein n=1 Tax=Streptomyces sp. NPDC057494 TaxID=3346148 RepID=UPI0036BBD076